MTEVMVGAAPNDIQTNQPAASPTDHVHPGHISNDNKAILTVPLVLLAFSIVVVGLRIWTRARMVKFFGMDDWWILGALIVLGG
ncbi:hypothetical protein TWF481_004605 [Arthrobotrys musiformis]|uniref:Uncharacterized protein n=1 Tax=Arthrobotrys musiformis TaxID=47236 RepID=A0AAV9WK06_9PEZI